jgi:hypothetical protein
MKEYMYKYYCDAFWESIVLKNHNSIVDFWTRTTLNLATILLLESFVHEIFLEACELVPETQSVVTYTVSENADINSSRICV